MEDEDLKKTAKKKKKEEEVEDEAAKQAEIDAPKPSFAGDSDNSDSEPSEDNLDEDQIMKLIPKKL